MLKYSLVLLINLSHDLGLLHAEATVVAICHFQSMPHIQPLKKRIHKVIECSGTQL